MQEAVVSPDEVMSALRRYLEDTGDTQRAAAIKIGLNRHSLCRWLSEIHSPKKENLLMVAAFLRRAG